MTAIEEDAPKLASGPVLLAYDGSELAAHAIREAGSQLASGRDALVVCVWQPADVGFVPVDGQRLNAQCAVDVEHAAQSTAAHGAQLAEHCGFRPRTCAIEMAPTWKGIIRVAHEREASIIVIGSHRHSGIIGHLVGSVASAVVTHSRRPVLVVHPTAEPAHEH